MRILLVEDDQQIATLITTTLKHLNYLVDVAVDGESGWALLEEVPYALILLDVELPKLDGLSVCRRLRAQKNTTPVLLLTARDTSTDKILGLDAGADDYMVKPFDVEELMARIRALLRRGGISQPPILSWGNLQLDPSSQAVTYGGQFINLRPKEYALLELFLRNPQRVFSRSAILDHLWSFDNFPNESTIKAHIKGLRQALKPVGAEEVIETLYGQGYRLNPRFLESAVVEVSSTLIDRRAATQAKVAEIWHQVKGLSFERLAYIEQAVQALVNGHLTEALRTTAEHNAHKLAGALGSFGFYDASQTARALELQFAGSIALGELDIATILDLLPALQAQLGRDRHRGTISTLTEFTHPSTDDAETSGVVGPILCVTRDRAWVEQLQQPPEPSSDVDSGNWQWSVVSSIAAAQEWMQSRLPAVIVLDVTDDAHEVGAVWAFLADLTQQGQSVLVVSEQADWRDRLTLVRHGGRQLLTKSTPVSALRHTIATMGRSPHYLGIKLAILDDDPQSLLLLCQALEQQGIQVTVVDQPSQLWETLVKTMPHLVVLDVSMPEIDGFELCQMIRSNPVWANLPIVFLSMHQDGQTMQRALALGATDYLTKDLPLKKLVHRLVDRLDRLSLW